MIKKYLMSLLALTAMTAGAQETLYLVKGDQVVGKYASDAVDYLTFELPSDVKDSPLSIEVENVGKNTVTYKVQTNAPDVAYAHNIMSWYEINLFALNYYDQAIDELPAETVALVLKDYLIYGAYVGFGTDSYTMTDFADDGTGSDDYPSRFSVVPGVKYFVAAWELDPVDMEPLEAFEFTTFQTEEPGESPYEVDVKFAGEVADGLEFNISAPSEILYYYTVYGMKDMMDSYIADNGYEFLLYTFGQRVTPQELEEYGSVWPAYDNGEYVLYVRGFDAQGNVSNPAPTVVNYESAPAAETPVIKIGAREKGAGFVDVDFEITPSNVSEAYCRLMTENDVDDRLNMGYELWELACGGDAADITDTINNFGEYTYTNNELGEEWYTLLIYAKAADGGKTVARVNFWPDSESYWSIDTEAETVAPKKAPRKMRLRSAKNPSMTLIRKK